MGPDGAFVASLAARASPLRDEQRW
jgi:hypothetical protein